MGKKKILVVDDDEGIQDIFQIILDRAGYDVTVFSRANAVLENKFSIPDLFILDKQLSGKDGLTVCRFLKSQESTKHIPVIIVSATPHIKKLSKAAGAEASIEKPFQIKELLNLVEEWI